MPMKPLSKAVKERRVEMTEEIRNVAGRGNDPGASDVVATPEGDNEIPPDQPLRPASDAAVSGLEVPRGNDTDEYKNDKR